jgi:hypothetical protein
MHTRTALLSSLLVMLAACGNATPEGKTQQAIEGGNVDSGDSTVGLVWRSDNRELCTGTLISTKFVLTAAHCFNGYAPGSKITFYTGRGTGGVRNSNPSLDYDPSLDAMLTAHAVSSLYIAPGFVDACPNTNDSALLLLSWPISGGAATFAHPGTPMPAVNASVGAVGYGVHTVGGIAYVGEKYSATENVVAVNAGNIKVDWAGAANGLAASGDSGGPLFFGGQVVGTVMCHDNGGNEYYQRIDQVASWIDSTVQGWEQQCYDACQAGFNSCGNTCQCMIGYDNCLSFRCGNFTPVTFHCLPTGFPD